MFKLNNILISLLANFQATNCKQNRAKKFSCLLFSMSPLFQRRKTPNKDRDISIETSFHCKLNHFCCLHFNQPPQTYTSHPENKIIDFFLLFSSACLCLYLCARWQIFHLNWNIYQFSIKCFTNKEFICCCCLVVKELNGNKLFNLLLTFVVLRCFLSLEIFWCKYSPIFPVAFCLKIAKFEVLTKKYSIMVSIIIYVGKTFGNSCRLNWILLSNLSDHNFNLTIIYNSFDVFFSFGSPTWSSIIY